MRAVVMIGWTDVPHLDESQKESIFKSIPPYQRDARSKGKPYLGAGQIYKLDEEDIKVRPFEIPRHWFRGYGLDVGWNVTAAPFMAYDNEGETWYVYDEYWKGEAEPSIHAAAIKARGAWMSGEIDPASRGRSQKDGEQLLKIYRTEGLQLHEAVNAVEAGVLLVWQLLSTGRMKVFSHCQRWLKEFGLYRRDEKGHVVKQHDHLMDGTRYRVMGPFDHLKQAPVVDEDMIQRQRPSRSRSGGWMSV